MRHAYVLIDKLDNKWLVSFSTKLQTKKLIIKPEIFPILLTKLLREAAHSHVAFPIYFCDLNILILHINENKTLYSEFLLGILQYKNVYYTITIKDILHVNKILIIKDYFHFVRHHNNTTPTTEKLLTLQDLIKFVEGYNINIHIRRIITLTSIAIRLFYKISPQKKKLIKSLRSNEDNFIRKSFFGGRADIFVPYCNTGEDLFYYDVNSLYPFVMRNYTFPIGKPKYVIGSNIKPSEFYGFIDALVECSDSYIAYLPKRLDNSSMGVIYPTGCFRGVFFLKELEFALTKGYKIIKIYSGYSFESSNIFDAFIDNLYSARISKNNKNISKLIKLMMNAIYGKYATISEQIISSTNNVHEIITIRYRSVAISAAIASYARLYMYSIINNYSNHLVYWDTDGLILKVPLKDEFIDPTALGKFKVVAILNKFVAVATKFYMYRISNTNTWVYVFRGITISKYILHGNRLFKLFGNHIFKNLSQTDVSITLKLLTKDNEVKLLQFTFIAKRKLYLDDNNIKTIPWNIRKI